MTPPTTQDRTSDALPDDGELQRRLEVYYEQRLTRRGVGPLLILAAVVVLAVLGVWWACGTLQLLNGWFTDWGTVPSSSQSQPADQLIIPPTVDPNLTLPPAPTRWERWSEKIPSHALWLGLIALSTVCLSWVHHVFVVPRWNTRLLTGVRSFGLHACPRCGGDTRSEAETKCRFCREIISERVPPYWREFILDDSRFSSPGFELKELKLQSQRFPGTPSRFQPSRRKGFLWISASIIFIMICVILITTFSPHPIVSFMLGFIPCAVAVIGFTLGFKNLVYYTRVSKHGFCPRCTYELMDETTSDRCSECGNDSSEGQRVYEIRHAPFWIRCVPVTVAVMYIWSFFFL